MKQLRTRFILFNILVISGMMLILALLVWLSERSTLSVNRMVFAVGVSVLLVGISSLLLSGIALAPIKAAWQKQLDFTADASHELRTPLSTIQANLDVVMSNPTATVASQAKWLNYIDMEQKRMSRLVSDLLFLSRADTHEELLHRDNLDLSRLADEGVEVYAAVARDHALTLTSAIKPDLVMHGDTERIKQLLLILLDNAVKYNRAGGSIHLVLDQRGQYAILEVSDTGIGIGEEERMKVFDRFYRGRLSRPDHPEGSGLGLAIARLIAEEHGGTISVQSQLHKGSTFSILLPLC